jgi:hypothetical protein
MWHYCSRLCGHSRQPGRLVYRQESRTSDSIQALFRLYSGSIQALLTTVDTVVSPAAASTGRSHEPPTPPHARRLGFGRNSECNAHTQPALGRQAPFLCRGA